VIRYVTTSNWWRRALAGEPVTIRDGEPQPGYYRTKLVKGGPWVPARIWVEREFDEDGEQVNEDKFRCVIGDAEADPMQKWVWLSGHPISLADYKQMRSQTNQLPATQAVNLATMPPVF
jgi:hypothetical protein